MSWLLAVAAAGVAVYYLLRARKQAAGRFDEVLRAQERARRKSKDKRGDLDRRA